ncbi:MAG: hypothetical protein M1838_003701 [Thelocarpon superellum]|nr:MAG: hypothetical protein M1838_003701 [Thelocarpon superellum]
MGPFRLTIDGVTFRDAEQREVTLRGINVAGDAKFPSRPDLPSHLSDRFLEGDDISFVNRPFSLEDAHTHFARLKRWGYNTIRYIFMWEAIEHAGPGKYDEAYIDHTIALLRLAKTYGFYIFMDPHQDVWSRFTGGSGAPLWTVYACGLDPTGFLATEAALVHNTYPKPAEYPKMIWSTNYTRLACQVLFTLFFAGKDFAPKAIIDGRNIQDYLQDHFFAACRHLATRIHEAGDLERDVVVGWESLNEPNRGLVGWPDLSVVPEEQKLQKGTSPTAWQAILTGAGRACEISTWEFGSMGPYKSGTALIDPKGVSAWLPADFDDTRYGWKRDPSWKLGECIWAQHGVWDPATDTLRNKRYFATLPQTGEKLDYEWFTNQRFMPFYRKFRDAIRSVDPDCIMFCQPPVLEIPPSLRGTEDDDAMMVYAPHYYDGLTLMTKKWNRLWNVDVFGLLRGRYMSPAFAVKVGEAAIRNCLRDQLSAIRNEGLDYMGDHPCMLTEIGIPYDMDDKYAYRTGDYTSQALAMDANHFAIEGSRVNGFMLWLYMTQNNHQWGDQWNGEDLSIFSVDDQPLPLTPSSQGPSPAYVTRKENESSQHISPANLKTNLSTPSIGSEPPTEDVDLSNSPGFRAAEAYVRPSPIATVGSVQSYGFDLRNCTFTFALVAPHATTESTATEVFLPEFHFPSDNVDIQVSSGRWTISVDDADGGLMQRLRWWHGPGKQTMTVKGVVRRQGMAMGREEEEGYLDQCLQSRCVLM